jgi:hypothetical protein
MFNAASVSSLAEAVVVFGGASLLTQCLCQHPLDKRRAARQVSSMKHYSRDAFVISFLLVSVLLATWLGISGPLIADASKQPYQWFKDFQPLIGAAFAGIGLYIAWRNVSRQLDQQRVSTRLIPTASRIDRRPGSGCD